MASENGVVPVIKEVNKETEVPKAINGLSEHLEVEESPAIKEVEAEKSGQREREPTENGIQEVTRTEESTSHSENVSPLHCWRWYD